MSSLAGGVQVISVWPTVMDGSTQAEPSMVTLIVWFRASGGSTVTFEGSLCSGSPNLGPKFVPTIVVRTLPK